jgi:hypothetical protein
MNIVDLASIVAEQYRSARSPPRRDPHIWLSP